MLLIMFVLFTLGVIIYTNYCFNVVPVLSDRALQVNVFLIYTWSIVTVAMSFYGFIYFLNSL